MPVQVTIPMLALAIRLADEMGLSFTDLDDAERAGVLVLAAMEMPEES